MQKLLVQLQSEGYFLPADHTTHPLLQTTSSFLPLYPFEVYRMPAHYCVLFKNYRHFAIKILHDKKGLQLNAGLINVTICSTIRVMWIILTVR